MPLTLRQVREIRRPDILFSVARVPNSERLLVGSSQGKVFELDASQASPTARDLADHGRYVTTVRLNGNTVISGGYDGRLIWWDLERGQAIRTIADAHGKWIRCIAVSPDGRKIASVADDMVCRIWDAASAEKLQELRGHQERTPTNFSSMLYVCTFSADGRHLATGDRVGHVIIWDEMGRQAGALDAPELYTWDGRQRIRSIGGIRALAFSPDGAQLAVGGVGQIGNVDGLGGPSRVEIFNWSRPERVATFTGTNGLVNRLQYHPQNRWLFAIGGGNNGFVMFYDAERRSMIHTANLPMHIHDAVFNEDFSTFYAVGHNGLVVNEVRS